MALEILEVKRLKQQLTQKTENLCPGIQETKLRLPETLGEDRETNVSTKYLRLNFLPKMVPGTVWRTGSSSCKLAWRSGIFSVKPEMSLVERPCLVNS